jgi:hypothetical protein
VAVARAVDDPTPIQVAGGKLERDLVAGEDPVAARYMPPLEVLERFTVHLNLLFS